MVNDPEPACVDAAYELGRLGPDALPALMEALQADHGEVASTADTPYGKLAKASRSEEVRRNISYALVAVGAPAVPELIAATEHGDWWVRDTAVEALGDIGLQAREAVPSLVERLEDESLQVRRHASEALGMAGQKGPAAVPALSGVLRQDDEVGRRNAALALARIGPSAHDAVPALKEALGDDDRYVRGKAVEALNRIGTPDAREPLIDYLMSSRWCDLTTADSLY
jgi:HEAT repeat protein